MLSGGLKVLVWLRGISHLKLAAVDGSCCPDVVTVAWFRLQGMYYVCII